MGSETGIGKLDKGIKWFSFSLRCLFTLVLCFPVIVAWTAWTSASDLWDVCNETLAP